MKVLVVSNMYPDKLNQSYGIFVKRFCSQLDKIGIEYEKSVMYKGNSKLNKITGYIKFYVSTALKIIFNKYDVIYVHYASHSAIPVIIASKVKKVNVFTNVHGSDVVPENSRQEKMQFFTRKLLKLSNKVIVPSEYFKEYTVEKYNLEKAVISIYPSAGINPGVFYEYNEEQKQSARTKLSLEKDEIVIGFVGRISKGKGWDTFVKGLDYFCSQNENSKIKIFLIGSGIEEELLNAEIAKSFIKDKIVRFQLLPEKELADIYNILTLLVFPTEREGESLGLVALEAMSCGVPVIASDFAAPKYYINDGDNGYKYEVKNYEHLAECIEKYILLEENEKKRLSSNAYNTAADFFENNIIKKLESIF